MTVAKGLTAGYVPMGAVLTSEKIYAGIADAAPDAVIGHGYTYSGHPVSAAVGLEVIRLYTDGGILANGQKVSRIFEAGLADLANHPLIGEARSRGMLGALELVSDKAAKTPFEPALAISDRLFRAGYNNGTIFRAFTDGTIGLAPPCPAPKRRWKRRWSACGAPSITYSTQRTFELRSECHHKELSLWRSRD